MLSSLVLLVNGTYRAAILELEGTHHIKSLNDILPQSTGSNEWQRDPNSVQAQPTFTIWNLGMTSCTKIPLRQASSQARGSVSSRWERARIEDCPSHQGWRWSQTWWVGVHRLQTCCNQTHQKGFMLIHAVDLCTETIAAFDRRTIFFVCPGNCSALLPILHLSNRHRPRYVVISIITICWDGTWQNHVKKTCSNRIVMQFTQEHTRTSPQGSPRYDRSFTSL